MKNIISLGFLLLFGTQLLAQLPSTNIYLFEMKQVTDSIYVFSKPKYLTQFNQNGFNNQPEFVGDDELYFTIQQNGTEQTEICKLNLANNSKKILTATADSEYSPTMLDNAYEMSVVRVESDKKDMQRLWKFPMDLSSNGGLVFPNILDVGYYHWLTESKAALFIVGEPHSLVIANSNDQTSSLITSNIGRCFGVLPNGDLVFVHKILDSSWVLKSLDLNSYNKKTITYTIPGSEDFVVMRDGTIIMAKGAKLFKFNKSFDKDWLEIADFSYYNFNIISRIALSYNNKIALVVE